MGRCRRREAAAGVSGPVALATPAAVRRIDVETAEEMYKEVHQEIATTDIRLRSRGLSARRLRQKIA
jgi:phosphopantothenoylcysteine decarboxylase/phosphopantothenate--cysteine ligase